MTITLLSSPQAKADLEAGKEPTKPGAVPPASLVRQGSALAAKVTRS